MAASRSWVGICTRTDGCILHARHAGACKVGDVGEEDYEVWPSMQDALPPAAELGPQSQRGGGGAPSHRAQHTDVPSQPDYNDKGTYSSAPSFQQRL